MANPVPLCVAGGYPVWRCAACATDFVSPAPGAAEGAARYDRAERFEEGEPDDHGSCDVRTERAPMFDSLFASLLDSFDESQGLSILDIGCGYGTNLAQAFDRGWKCFGVEGSAHARRVIAERHGRRFFVVDSVGQLLPHAFDLIVMLDVIEHLSGPVQLFYELFAKGAITPSTRVCIATPNARSGAAIADPARGSCRDLPSRLVCFSAESLHRLLRQLRFTDIAIDGLQADEALASVAGGYSDECFPRNDALRGFAAIRCLASGSDFASFMQERYVPGTWSSLAAYEHLPRYALASELARSAEVLDFGCGTGYGSAMLAATARSVTGLDIDGSALEWARAHHRVDNLRFLQDDRLAADLPAASFDLITCFEMIEHVDETTQRAAIAQFQRLLRADGVLLISTPNPEVTKRYGENPHHLREMTREEFRGVLGEHFPRVMMLKQWMQPSIVIADESGRDLQQASVQALRQDGNVRAPLPGVAGPMLREEPAAFVALCSQRDLPDLRAHVFVDDQVDLVRNELDRTRWLDQERFAHYSAAERVVHLEDLLQAATRNLQALDAGLQAVRAELAGRDRQLDDARRSADALRRSADALRGELQTAQVQREAIENSDWYQLGRTIRTGPRGVRQAMRIAQLSGRMILPSPVRLRLRPAARWMHDRLKPRRQVPAEGPAAGVAPDGPSFPSPYTYSVRRPLAAADAVRVAHVIANFMTGGSSRLVVDIVERLGEGYSHKVFTSFIPTPPAYEGVDVAVFPGPQVAASLRQSIEAFAPDIVHLHYWGDTDEPWYRQAFEAVAALDVPIVENVNTPVAPLVHDLIARYVFVSRTVLDEYGAGARPAQVVYPGSDFSLFTRPEDAPLARDCIGMVYRLEPDKLNESSIDPLIHAVRERPGTHAIVVGGGRLLAPFQEKVASAGLAPSFTFTGYVAYEALPALYEQFSVFVAPVWKESFGQVSSFAMSMGIPVVGYRAGAMPEIVCDDTLLAEPQDAPALGRIIVGLLDDRERSVRVGRANRDRIRDQFSVESMVEQYRRIYAELHPARR